MSLSEVTSCFFKQNLIFTNVFFLDLRSDSHPCTAGQQHGLLLLDMVPPEPTFLVGTVDQWVPTPVRVPENIIISFKFVIENVHLIQPGLHLSI